MVMTPSCCATYSRPSGPNCSDVARLVEVPASLLLSNPTRGARVHGCVPLRKNTSWASVGLPLPGTCPPAATYTPPLQTAAWIPCRGTGMEVNVRQVFVTVL